MAVDCGWRTRDDPVEMLGVASDGSMGEFVRDYSVCTDEDSDSTVRTGSDSHSPMTVRMWATLSGIGVASVVGSDAHDCPADGPSACGTEFIVISPYRDSFSGTDRCDFVMVDVPGVHASAAVECSVD